MLHGIIQAGVLDGRMGKEGQTGIVHLSITDRGRKCSITDGIMVALTPNE